MKRLILALLLSTLAFTAHAATDAAKPKVRAITAFVRLDRSTYEAQIADTMKVLNAARSEFASHGYETQTVRIVTQPFAQLVKGLSDEQALVFLKALDGVDEPEDARTDEVAGVDAAGQAGTDAARDELHERRVVLDDPVPGERVAGLEPAIPPVADVDGNRHARGCTSA